MMNKKISYHSFYWSIGTTSFRMKQFNRMVEEQLRLLNEFWSQKDNINSEWNPAVQEKYYQYIKNQGFITGDEKKKDKNAREKTSGMVDLGLIYQNRRLTPVGKKLLDLSIKGNFASDNALLIEKDSFLYLKQLLKTSNKLEDGYVRPFVIVLYFLSKLKKITYDEFKYLLPLCINNRITIEMIDKIKSIRNGKTNIDDVIIDKFMSMENYKQALVFFISQQRVTKEIITQIGINRKSKIYDEQYFDTYILLKKIYLEGENTKVNDLYNNLKSLRLSRYWVRTFFANGSKKKVTINDIKQNDFSNIRSEIELKKIFFKYMHLFKIKATLDDYFDLNRRYIGLADIINFQDNTITLSIISNVYFNPIMDKLLNTICFTESLNLSNDIELWDIEDSLQLNEEILITNYNNIYKRQINSIIDIKKEYDTDRYVRFNKVLNSMFKKEKLIELLEYFKKREDSKINQAVTINADIPTIFEYIIAIIWYEISDRKGDILSYMNLSLDANLLPKSHASGGVADIIYQYDKCEQYPEHSLLIEVTLADKMNQRRMEMEPVSRHLGEYLLKYSKTNAYCVFITTYLDINVVNDFRSRSNLKFYDTKDHSKFINGMKIIPLETEILKMIIQKDYKYDKLYNLFDEVFLSKLDGAEWYTELKTKLVN